MNCALLVFVVFTTCTSLVVGQKVINLGMMDPSKVDMSRMIGSGAGTYMSGPIKLNKDGSMPDLSNVMMRKVSDDTQGSQDGSDGYGDGSQYPQGGSSSDYNNGGQSRPSYPQNGGSQQRYPSNQGQGQGRPQNGGSQQRRQYPSSQGQGQNQGGASDFMMRPQVSPPRPQYPPKQYDNDMLRGGGQQQQSFDYDNGQSGQDDGSYFRY